MIRGRRNGKALRASMKDRNSARKTMKRINRRKKAKNMEDVREKNSSGTHETESQYLHSSFLASVHGLCLFFSYWPL